MIYNIHPLLVHFPIAFLFVYSIIKIIPFRRLFSNTSRKSIERTLLFVGVLGAFLASSAGEIAEHIIKGNHQLIETHSFFAEVSIFIYSLLLLGELIPFLISFIISKLNIDKITKLFEFIQRILTHKILSKILAFIGFFAILITGLLGGVIVYGVSADPISAIILKLLGISI